LRIIFIQLFKTHFSDFEYTMNEVLILLSILAGIASFGLGLIIGPSVIALSLAAANLYSSQVDHSGFPEE